MLKGEEIPGFNASSGTLSLHLAPTQQYAAYRCIRAAADRVDAQSDGEVSLQSIKVDFTREDRHSLASLFARKLKRGEAEKREPVSVDEVETIESRHQAVESLATCLAEFPYPKANCAMPAKNKGNRTNRFVSQVTSTSAAHRSLTSIHLIGCTMPSDCLSSLVASLHGHSALREICFNGSALNDQAVGEIAQGLSSWQHIQVLQLCECSISASGCKQLLTALRNVTASAGFSGWASSLRQNHDIRGSNSPYKGKANELPAHSLKVLALSDNGMDDSAVEILAHTLKIESCGLREVYLARNAIGRAGAGAVLTNLQHCNVHMFDLTSNLQGVNWSFSLSPRQVLDTLPSAADHTHKMKGRGKSVGKGARKRLKKLQGTDGAVYFPHIDQMDIRHLVGTHAAASISTRIRDLQSAMRGIARSSQSMPAAADSGYHSEDLDQSIEYSTQGVPAGEAHSFGHEHVVAAIDDLQKECSQVLKMAFHSDSKMLELEKENTSLKNRVQQLERQLIHERERATATMEQNARQLEKLLGALTLHSEGNSRVTTALLGACHK